MSPTPTISDDRPADPGAADAGTAAPAPDDAAAAVLIEELLIEEISIDGMCGVY